MLISAYAFATILGGALLAFSIVGGDGDHDADGLHDDADAGGGDGHSDHGAADQGLQGVHAAAGAGGSVIGLFGVALSLRFWTFFAAFFGLTGLVLDGLDLVAGELPPLALAVGMGLLAGTAVQALMGRLTGNDTGVVAGVDDYVGKVGRVLVPIAATPGAGPGKLRIELKGTTVDLLARTDEPAELPVGTHALIVGLDDTTALVVAAPVAEHGGST